MKTEETTIEKKRKERQFIIDKYGEDRARGTAQLKRKSVTEKK